MCSKLKIITILLAATLLAGMAPQVSARQKGVSRSRMTALVSEFQACEGFEARRVGPLILGIAKMAIRYEALSGDADDKTETALALDLLDGLKRVDIISCEDCEAPVRERLSARLESLLPQDNLLMEVLSDDESIRMYGVLSDNGKYLSDFIMYNLSEYAIICMYGKLPLESVLTFIKETSH